MMFIIIVDVLTDWATPRIFLHQLGKHVGLILNF